MQLIFAVAAVVGWIFIVPPVGPGPQFRIDDTKPVTDWEQVGAFDTAKQCVAEYNYPPPWAFTVEHGVTAVDRQ